MPKAQSQKYSQITVQTRRWCRIYKIGLANQDFVGADNMDCVSVRFIAKP
jgi:hypothetical protein